MGMIRRRLSRPFQLISQSLVTQQSASCPIAERSCLHVLAHHPHTGTAQFSAHAAVQTQPLIQQQPNYGFAAAALVQQAQAALPESLAQPESLAEEKFLLKVCTGNLRGAGTPSVASLQLIGTQGISQKVVVGTDELGTLDRGSVRTVEVWVPKHSIGQLRRVHVEKRMASHISGDGWYLKHVEVCTPDGESTLFPCEAWLGESDCGSYAGKARHTGSYSHGHVAPHTHTQTTVL